ncbi:MAG: hypothetical protein SFY92_02915, partial [Verrucomicrobiae bacterium]|nr:hypothetical protein [Verrucomicrobiae bacterium]
MSSESNVTKFNCLYCGSRITGTPEMPDEIECPFCARKIVIPGRRDVSDSEILSLLGKEKKGGGKGQTTSPGGGVFSTPEKPAASPVSAAFSQSAPTAGQMGDGKHVIIPLEGSFSRASSPAQSEYRDDPAPADPILINAGYLVMVMGVFGLLVSILLAADLFPDARQLALGALLAFHVVMVSIGMMLVLKTR